MPRERDTKHPRTLQAHTTLAPDSLLGHPWNTAFWDLLTHDCFGSSYLANVPLLWSTPGPPSCTTLWSQLIYQGALSVECPRTPQPMLPWLQSHCQGTPCTKDPRVPWFAPISASAVLPGCPLCAEHWRCHSAHFSYNWPARVPPEWGTLPWLHLPYQGTSCAEHLVPPGSCPASAPATLPVCPLYGEPWDILVASTSASAILLGCPLYRETRDFLGPCPL